MKPKRLVCQFRGCSLAEPLVLASSGNKKEKETEGGFGREVKESKEEKERKENLAGTGDTVSTSTDIKIEEKGNEKESESVEERWGYRCMVTSFRGTPAGEAFTLGTHHAPFLDIVMLHRRECLVASYTAGHSRFLCECNRTEFASPFIVVGPFVEGLPLSMATGRSQEKVG